MKLGARVRVGGLVADGLRRPPTAKGTSFIRLEMWTGELDSRSSAAMVDVIIPLDVYAERREALRGSAFLVVEGRLQRLWPTVTIAAVTASRLP